MPTPTQTTMTSRETVGEPPPLLGTPADAEVFLVRRGQIGFGSGSPNTSRGTGGDAPGPAAMRRSPMTLCACAPGQEGRGGPDRGGAGGCGALSSAAVPGDVMGKKQVVSEPQVLLSCWEFSLRLFSGSSFEGLRGAVSRWVRWFIFAGLLKYQEDWVPLS